ncbi:MAG: class I SAM-dependent methyltransferase [Spirochaetota bacterium]
MKDPYQRTINYYQLEAPAAAATYESVDFGGVTDRVLRYIQERGRLLEVGCGSGRDAAYYLGRGFDVTATDASAHMLSQAFRLHPDLEGHLVHHQLPNPLPFADGAFDVVTAMAVLMHLTAADAETALGELARVTRPGGIVAYSVSTHRPNLDPEGFDPKGRYFICLNEDEWSALNSASGFLPVDSWPSRDLNGRVGVQWVTFVCRRG